MAINEHVLFQCLFVTTATTPLICYLEKCIAGPLSHSDNTKSMQLSRNFIPFYNPLYTVTGQCLSSYGVACPAIITFIKVMADFQRLWPS